jgi:CMP-N-acetylneuraminic acid synthetase
MILAVIPARAGSKRLPGKNIAPFGGRPLLTWSVAMAKRCSAVVRCLVSTESLAIAAIAREAGAEVVHRPIELSADESSITEVVHHAALSAQQAGLLFRGVMLLQPTNPLRPLELVTCAIERFLSEPCDALMAVSRRSYKLGRVVDGAFIADYPFGVQSRHTPSIFYENGLLYLTKSEVLLNERSLTGNRVLAFETQRPFDEVDIDEPIDLLVGEAILSTVRHRLDY